MIKILVLLIAVLLISVTGMYNVAMTLFAAIGAYAITPITHATSWQTAVIIISIVALIAAIIWWFFGRHQEKAVAADVSADSQDQKVKVEVNGGYSPSTIVLKKGVPAELDFYRKDPSSCLERVVFPDMGINEKLPQNQLHQIKVDTSKAGEYEFACGMNMFHGKVIVK